MAFTKQKSSAAAVRKVMDFPRTPDFTNPVDMKRWYYELRTVLTNQFDPGPVDATSATKQSGLVLKAPVAPPPPPGPGGAFTADSDTVSADSNVETADEN